LIAIAFAIGIGHLAWNTLAGPPPDLAYMVGGDVPVYSAPDPAARKLYLRRELYLAVRPQHAWIQLLGYDHLRLYVNEQMVEDKQFDGFTVAILADLSPFLRIGNNVIAIHAEQTSLRRSPVVAVEGEYAYTTGDTYSLGEVDVMHWRCNTVFEREAGWWFTLKFKDGHWPRPIVSSRYLRGKLTGPPEAIKTRSQAKWVTSLGLDHDSAAVRREFTVGDHPRRAWLRAQALGSHRLAINGLLLDQREDQLETDIPVPPVKRFYDITAYVRPGANVLAAILTRTGMQPFFMADIGVEDESGEHTYVASDGQWQSRAGLPEDWSHVAVDEPSQWQPCELQRGELDIMTYQPQYQRIMNAVPFPESARRQAWQVGLVAGIALASMILCRLVHLLLLAPLGKWLGRPVPLGIVYLPLVLPTVAIAAAVLATYDPRIDPGQIYRSKWLWAALAAVPVQWLMLLLFIGGRRLGARVAHATRGRILDRGLAWVVMLGLVAAGFALRMRDIDTEPLMWDEVRVYDSTMGVLQRGYPSVRISPDVPVMYTATSELVYYVDALGALVFKSDTYITRFPQVIWSTLTIVLIYWVGRRMFNRAVGLTAAVIYTFSPVIIAMADFGRYFDQLQFFTLLTAYYFWLTVRGTGPLNNRALWLTVVSFIAMFLSWEGGALIVPGMILAALVQRRGQLRTLFFNSSVWLGMVLIGTVVVVQYSLRVFQQTTMLVYGTGISDLKLKPMWPYAIFNLWYYIWEACWNLDALIPMVGLLGGILLAIVHRWRNPARYLVIIHLTTCFLMSAILPLIAWRYIHHFIPLHILVGAAAFVAAAHGLVRLVRQPGLSGWWLAYARGVAVAFVLALLVAGSGICLRCAELDRFRILGYEDTLMKFPDLGGPTNFVREHMQPGDIVICTHPHSATHLMYTEGFTTDYWIESTLQLQALLGNTRTIPLDRRSGAVMLSSLEAVQDIFARHDRIWYIMVPQAQTKINDADVSAYLRQNMEVAYEDVASMVLFWGHQHFPATRRFQDDQALFKAKSAFIQ
jgi:hypothetical protein